jgi:putative transcriptional regulator
MMTTMRSMLVLLCSTLLAPLPLSAQTPQDGALLVATPELEDPNFSQSVVLVLRHDENGTLGLVVNRVTSLSPVRVFPEFSPALDSYEGALYRGGPISAARVLFLIRGLAAAVVQERELIEDLYVSGDAELLPELAALAEGQDGLRLYAGHAEWDAGQLDEEIAAGSWRVIPGNVDLVFADPRALWEELSTLGEAVADAGDR